MKILLTSLVCVSGLLATTASAQVLSERAARNVLIGGVAGAIIGENNNHRALEGALIGAAAGAVWTSATEPRDGYRRVEYRDSGYTHRRHEWRRHGGEVVVVNPDCGPRVIVQERYVRPDRVIIRDNDCDTRVIVRERPVVIRDGGCDGRVIIVNRTPGARVVVNGNTCDDRYVDYFSDRCDNRRDNRRNRTVIYQGSSATYVQVEE
ncbi:hypothetical protein [Nibricoccus sp. IMCC34717]|uniref:hypothetical protein n=1 Tax=Nibricoccus sp. IMCC34717 TaxID=3034021 RepID=UPI00384C9FEE